MAEYKDCNGEEIHEGPYVIEKRFSDAVFFVKKDGELYKKEVNFVGEIKMMPLSDMFTEPTTHYEPVKDTKRYIEAQENKLKFFKNELGKLAQSKDSDFKNYQ